MAVSQAIFVWKWRSLECEKKANPCQRAFVWVIQPAKTRQIVCVYMYVHLILSSRVRLEQNAPIPSISFSVLLQYISETTSQYIRKKKEKRKTDSTTHKHAQSTRISLSFKTNCSLFCFTLHTKFVVSGSARSKSASAELLIFTRFKEHSNP